jgi:hypothetical protein
MDYGKIKKPLRQCSLSFSEILNTVASGLRVTLGDSIPLLVIPDRIPGLKIME